MSKFIFASLAHPNKYAYAYDSDAWKGHETSASFRMFETYGDGLTQHSGDWSVTWEYLTDYLFSLATAMQSNDELTQALFYTITRKPSIHKIDFAATVAWKTSDENYSKRRFYSMELQKVGSRATKQFDKRFNEISTYEDGSLASILRMVTPDYADGFQRFQYAQAVKEWSYTQKSTIYDGDSFPVWFDGDRAKTRALRDALAACILIVDARQNRLNAESYLESYNSRIQREQAAEITSAA